MRSITRSIAALAASFTIASAALVGAAFAAESPVQPYSQNTLEEYPDEKLWYASGGSIKTYDLKSYSEKFKLNYSEITVGGNKSIMTTEYNHDNKYKFTTVKLKGEKGTRSVSSPDSQSLQPTATAEMPETIVNALGDLESGTYYSYLYLGKTIATDYLERSLVEVEVAK